VLTHLPPCPLLLELPGAQSPFARPRCYLARRGLLDHVRRRYPAVIALTGSCVSPQPSPCLRITLGQRVCAGCCQPRLGGGPSRRCSAHLSLRHSIMFRPAGLLTTPVAPTATDSSVWQPLFLRPSNSWFVTSPRPGYACRPNRAIDGRGLSPHKMRSLVGCSPNARTKRRGQHHH
jgi:hypothetical protein